MSTEADENGDRQRADSTDRASLLTLEDFRALSRTGRELSKELGLDRLLQAILEAAGDLTDSPDTSIILRSHDEASLYIAAATGKDAKWILSTHGLHGEKHIPIQGSKAGMVFESGQPLVENIVRDHFAGVDEETRNATRSMVCVPLNVGSQRLGVIQVLNKTSGEYTLRDSSILEHFADQASVAIRNARLMESLLAHSGLYGSKRSADELFARMNELHLDARTETLTVLFADMRGFTQLCQSLLNPVLVQERLSEFISMLSRKVLEHEGMVNKFLGDGVMALFQGEESSVRAVQCAFSMVDDFIAMKARWDSQSNQQLDFLDLGVGITTDQVILGGVGDSDIRDYTAIGTAVNLAAAFESNARNGKQILCDQLTYVSAKDIVSGPAEPEDFVLQKPGQERGVRYKCFSLQALQDTQRASIFISHSHEDRDYVERLISDLEAKGLKAWYSVSDIPKGALWTAEIRKAISNCNWMVVIVSRNAAGSRWISREVDLAVTSKRLEDRIIPVAIDTTDLQKVNEYLGTMQSVYFNTCDDIPGALLERVNTAQAQSSG